MTYQYTNVNGYLIPNLSMNQPRRDLGKFGRMGLRHLQQNKPFQYEKMLSQGTLYPSLLKMEEQMQEQIDRTVAQLQAEQKATCPDRKTDPLGWTQWMNGLKMQAEELAMPMLYEL